MPGQLVLAPRVGGSMVSRNAELSRGSKQKFSADRLRDRFRGSESARALLPECGRGNSTGLRRTSSSIWRSSFSLSGQPAQGVLVRNCFIRTQCSIGVLSPPMRSPIPLARRSAKHVQVQLRGQPPVQAQLFVTKKAAAFERREIDEAERHGLLHLVGEFSGEEDPGNVGL